MGHVVSELCHKGTIYKRIIRKWSFSYNSFVKFHGKKILEPQHDCVISKSIQCYNEVCYKGTELYHYDMGWSEYAYLSNTREFYHSLWLTEVLHLLKAGTRQVHCRCEQISLHTVSVEHT